MSPEKQNLLIAQICGWINVKSVRTDYGSDASCEYELRGTPPELKDQPFSIRPVPDYVNNLNATHKMEECLGYIDNWLKYEGFLDEGGTKFLFHATAAQKAEAFLRVFGLWEEKE